MGQSIRKFHWIWYTLLVEKNSLWYIKLFNLFNRAFVNISSSFSLCVAIFSFDYSQNDIAFALQIKESICLKTIKND